MIKKMYEKFMHILKDIVEQVWTILGLFIAWLVLEGTAREITGILILTTIAIWIFTHRIRKF